MIEDEKIVMGASVSANSTVSLLFPGNFLRVFKIVSNSNDVAPENSIISIYSPLGKTLLGKKEGDEIEHDANQRRIKIKIVSVS